MKAKIMRSDLEELLRLLRKYESTRDSDFYSLYFDKCDKFLSQSPYKITLILRGVIHSLVRWYGPKTPTDKVVGVLDLMGVVVTDE